MDAQDLDRRFNDLACDSPDDADVILLGLPFDGAVLGRKGCRDGPAGIRAAFSWLGTDDPRRGSMQTRWYDGGDVALPDDVHEAHALTRSTLAPLLGKRVVVLGGDNSLSFPTMQALCEYYEPGAGRVGLCVVDAHYDMRDYEGTPTSGTPFRRVLDEMQGEVVGNNLVEIGIRRHANAASLGAYAAAHGVHVTTRDDVRQNGAEAVAQDALRRCGDRTDHLWLSIDIDAFDQSIASGCSAPSPDGLLLHEVLPLVEAFAKDPRCRGMEIMETAPGLDPTGNTTRTAAALVARFMAYCG